MIWQPCFHIVFDMGIDTITFLLQGFEKYESIYLSFYIINPVRLPGPQPTILFEMPTWIAIR